MSIDAPPKPARLTKDHALTLLRQMLLIRRLEEKCAELYSLGKIRGFLHLCIGEEAVAVGALPALTSDDAVVTTYREHGHALVRGMSARAIMAEMYGKETGCSRGRGGSMHLYDAGLRFFGGSAIVGGGLPLAAGLALSDVMQNRRRVTACLFGDGAVDEGEFHETLNLASLWKLPVLFLCENNRYAMGTALERHQSQTDIHQKGAAYGIPSDAVDGMDVLAVEDAMQTAVEAVRSSGRPYLLEARTYRFRAHSMYDAELYRTKDEVEQWRQRDPLSCFARQLKSWKLLTDADEAGLEAAVKAEIDDAVAFAETSPWEPVEDLTKDVYTSPAEAASNVGCLAVAEVAKTSGVDSVSARSPGDFGYDPGSTEMSAAGHE
jgi:pyruvate dehydrogenase E1 component alpha subunit